VHLVDRSLVRVRVHVVGAVCIRSKLN
jgi:hypothetical protein